MADVHKTPICLSFIISGSQVIISLTPCVLVNVITTPHYQVKAVHLADCRVFGYHALLLCHGLSRAIKAKLQNKSGCQ